MGDPDQSTYGKPSVFTTYRTNSIVAIRTTKENENTSKVVQGHRASSGNITNRRFGVRVTWQVVQ